MTGIAFHFGAPNKLEYACRLLRKAVASGAKVLVVAGEDMLQTLDSDLWALSATDFVAHCTAAADDFVQRKSPIVLVTGMHQMFDHLDVLVNLSNTVPQGFDRFARVVEVVSTDEADRNFARLRWRQYTEQGYAIQRHDLNLKGAI